MVFDIKTTIYSCIVLIFLYQYPFQNIIQLVVFKQLKNGSSYRPAVFSIERAMWGKWLYLKIWLVDDWPILWILDDHLTNDILKTYRILVRVLAWLFDRKKSFSFDLHKSQSSSVFPSGDTRLFRNPWFRPTQVRSPEKPHR